MKKIIYTLIILFISSIYSYSQGYKIKVKVNGIHDTVAYLAYHMGSKQYAKDTAKVDKEGIALFSGKENLPGGMYIFYSPAFTRVKTFDFIVDKDQDFTLTTDTSDFIQNMIVKGSEDNEFWFNNIKFLQSKEKEVGPLKLKIKEAKTKNDSATIIKQIEEINKEVIEYRDKFIQNNPENFVAKLIQASKEPLVPEEELKKSEDPIYRFLCYKNHFFDNIDITDSRFIRTPELQKKIDTYVNNLTSQDPDSIIKSIDFIINKVKANEEVFRFTTSHFFNTYVNSQIMGYDAIMVHIFENYYMKNKSLQKDSVWFNKTKEHVEATKPLLLGQKAPNVVFKDSLDNFISIYSTKANYTVLVFWDSDCGHCKKELPLIKDNYNEILKAGMDVKIIAVCTEMEKKEWLDYLKGKDYNWIHVQDPYGERKKFDINSTPMIFILDKDKKIIAKKLKGEKIKEFIEYYEKKKATN